MSAYELRSMRKGTMLPGLEKRALAMGLLLAALVAGPALADVKTGVDAWSRGDYAVAVREWEPAASLGDPDAMFNLGQAYRLGRGVPEDKSRAEALYAAAAAAGHLQAADTYGLMLFQDGRREAALPYVREAARRGDPRSQYVLGVAHFNGDLVERDWTRAYAFLTLANSAGLPQAASAIAEMDRHIPLAQRQEAAGLAVRMRGEAESAQALELAAAELAVTDPAQPPARAEVPAASPRVPNTIATTAVSPSVAAARAAVAEASRATGTESPAEAGATHARPAARTEVAAAPSAAAQPSAPAVARTAPAPAATTGPWRVQLGAFSVAGNAERLWTQLSGRSELAGAQRLLVPAGRVTKLQAGGFASRSAADAACRSLKQSGQDCLVTDR
jgi:uncharacterized protein